ncbi:hypothetical protein AA106555_0134 [Neokomagataea thailandica NBRC 106555]|uniref:Uncharacterized protein n=1 Tax=Neokomagataea thailandica NBRC 106555 TaxID=1223520 RepID=A0ABQ0QM88_9PROT|nr:hypothetical protein AA106555_0134 [Neokomagataea thailandica NBRC 106555]
MAYSGEGAALERLGSSIGKVTAVLVTGETMRRSRVWISKGIWASKDATPVTYKKALLLERAVVKTAAAMPVVGDGRSTERISGM